MQYSNEPYLIYEPTPERECKTKDKSLRLLKHLERIEPSGRGDVKL
jgi:hypothetical protein